MKRHRQRREALNLLAAGGYCASGRGGGRGKSVDDADGRSHQNAGNECVKTGADCDRFFELKGHLEMNANPIHARRLPVRLMPDAKRTITRFFWPGEERAIKILSRIQRLSPAEISSLLADLLQQFTPVNPEFEACLMEH
jgi:hypothetical protein